MIISAPLFQLSPDLVATLRDVRATRGHDEITRLHDAFMLDPGLGPPTYLSASGQILWDDDMWGVKGTRGEAFAALFVGIEKTGVVALRSLLPSRPVDGTDCPDCRGTGRSDVHAQSADVKGPRFRVVCLRCAGLGWMSPSLDLEASVLSTHEIP